MLFRSTFDEVEEALAEMCSVVKENYSSFIAGQVFQFAGFVSDEGSIGLISKIGSYSKETQIAILTYWKSFDEHEKSHADALFKEKFNNLLKFCSYSIEYGYTNLWQGQRT